MLASVLLPLVFGCAAPRRIEKPPSSDRVLYGIGTAVHRSPEVAYRIALARAEKDLSREASRRILEMFRAAPEDLRLVRADELEWIVRDFALAVRKATTIRDEAVRREGEGHRATVLLELPLLDAKAAVVRRVRSMPGLYARLRRSSAFRHLEAEVADTLR